MTVTTAPVATIDVFWDGEHTLWKSRRREGGITVEIRKSYDNSMWEVGVNRMPFSGKDPSRFASFDGTLSVELDRYGYFIRVWAKAPAVRPRTAAAAAARFERDWGLAIVFRRDKFYGRDRRGHRKFLDVEPLKVVVGDQRIPSPEEP